MNYSGQNIKIIEARLDALRRRWSGFILLNGFVRALMLVVGLGFIIATVEGFRYFDSPVRLSILRFSSGFLIIFFLIPIILALLVRTNQMASFSNLKLARMLGNHFPGLGDRLLNGLQLYEMSQQRDSGFSLELADYSVQTVAGDIGNYNFTEIIPRKKLRKSLIQCGVVLVILAAIGGFNSDYYQQSLRRLLQPRQSFEIPLPFEIQSLTGSLEVFGGDTTVVVFQCTGRYPEQITFRENYQDYVTETKITPDDSGRIRLHLGAVRNTVFYEAFVENRSIFRPWQRISSGCDTIRVTDRPTLLAVKIQIDPPEYTGLPTEIQESNNLELMVLPGTRLGLAAIASKPLQSARLELKSGNQLKLRVADNSATGNLTVTNTDEFKILIFDQNGVRNLDPLNYSIRIIPDSYPICQLISPDADLELNEAMEIPLGIRIGDDYGFSKVLIRYRLIKKYAPDQTQSDSLEFPLKNRRLTLQELYYTWSVKNMQLSPEDLIEFQVIAYDNDPINGPKSATSRTLRARFPSLNDLFSGFYEQQDNVVEQSEELLRELQNAEQVLEQISWELLKNPDLNWEQKKQLTTEIQRTEKAAEKLSQISEQLDQMIEESRENNLFDEETLEKYAKLQQSFQDIMTPELRAAMEKLQQALEKMDRKEIQDALNQFRTNREQFSEEIDRMLQLLERVKIEQAVDEIVRRLEDLVNRQDNISQEIERTAETEKAKMGQLAQEEKTVERDTDVLLDVMERTSQNMQDFPLMPSRELAAHKQDFENSDVKSQMNQTRKALQNSEKNRAGKHSQTAQQRLQEYLEKMRQFQTDFNSGQMEELMSGFREVIYKTMQVSQSQEKISQMIRNTPRQSEQLMDVAVRQQQIRQNLSSVINDLIELSNKTFGLSSKAGKGFGQAAAGMNEAIRQMEERNTHAAASAANSSVAALNSAALNLINSMNELQQSGSASGFEQYLKQLENMAGQQQGINDETQLLGMSGGEGRRQALQRLAARQQQLRKSLEELQNEISESSEQTGDLGGVAKDMDEVIKDLQQNRVLRKTLERQQRILSRLLDAQKSLRTQDFKKERKSITGEDIYRESPGQLPADLGERQTVLRQNLEQAMKEGYTREYEELIRKYFELISSETNE
ncbi:MAG TPA: hypothetical protein ENN20_01585 [Candidatus Marinimicrobia bacterium]|nr:hypothetical protein [Candidatus Neomarinimicrobiota bacterium]